LGGQAFEEWIENNVPEESPLHVTGHSLGGALAQYLAYDLAENANRQLDLATFNALGGLKGEQDMSGQSFDPDRLANVDAANYTNAQDGVSRLGDGHLGGNVVQVDANA